MATLIAMGIFLFFVVGFPLLTTIIILREKRYVWEFEPQSETEVPTAIADGGESNPYATTQVASDDLEPTRFSSKLARQLKKLGFEYVGDYRHAKRGIYKIRYDFWISPDSDVLAYTGAGTLAGIQVENLVMVSSGQRLGTDSNSRSPVRLDSITNDAAYQPDLSGWLDTMVFPGASASEMLKLHRQRMQLIEPGRFSENPLGDLLEFSQFEANEVCRLGMGRFINDEKSIWLPSLFGGLKAVFKTYCFQLGQRFRPHRGRLKRMLKSVG